MKSAMLAQQDVAFFQEQGYIILKNLVDADTIRKMRENIQRDLDGLIEPIEFEADVDYPGSPVNRDVLGGQTVRRLKNAMVRNPVYLEWIAHSQLIRILSSLIPAPIYCPLAHHNCVMTKQPTFSSDTGWHQDIRYWSFNNSELISVWVALGEERKENGCLQVIPGSHLASFSVDQFDDRKFFRHDYEPNLPFIKQAKLVEMNAGDVLLFHAKVLHAATRNFTQSPKWAFVSTYHGSNTQPVPGSRSYSMPEIIFRQ